MTKWALSQECKDSSISANHVALSPLNRNKYLNLLNEYTSVSSSFSQWFSCIISVASRFNLNEFYLFFFLPPSDDLLPQGLSKSLQIWGRDVQALMWSGLPNWLGTLLKWGWSHLSATCAYCWNGQTLLQTPVPQSFTLQPSCPNPKSPPLLAFVHHLEVHMKWHAHITGTRGASVGSFA